MSRANRESFEASLAGSIRGLATEPLKEGDRIAAKPSAVADDSVELVAIRIGDITYLPVCKDPHGRWEAAGDCEAGEWVEFRDTSFVDDLRDCQYSPWDRLGIPNPLTWDDDDDDEDGGEAEEVDPILADWKRRGIT